MDLNSAPAITYTTSHSSLYIDNFPWELEHIPAASTNPDLSGVFATYAEFNLLDLPTKDSTALVYYSNGPIFPLDRTDHELEQRKWLNKHGLVIYLTEPICSHIVNDRYGHEFFHNFNFGFYSEFYNDNENLRTYRSKELDSIWKYIRRNALTNVTVRTCDYNISEYYTLYTDLMTLEYYDLFLREIKLYHGIDPTPKTKITKKFICPTWRYTTARYLLSNVLFDKDCDLSWFFAVAPNMCEQSAWANKEEMQKWYPGFYEKCIERNSMLNRHAPYTIDIDAVAATFVPEHAAHYYPLHTVSKELNAGLNPIALNEQKHGLQPWYRNVFVSIQIESRFAQPTGNYSEKVIQAIQYGTPFILVAPPFTLQCMREQGYKTFSAWWDESYDEETNHLLRLKKIVDIIEWIDTLSYDELFKMYNEMLPVLTYNLQAAIGNTTTGILYARTGDAIHHMQWQSEWSNSEFKND